MCTFVFSRDNEPIRASEQVRNDAFSFQMRVNANRASVDDVVVVVCPILLS